MDRQGKVAAGVPEERASPVAAGGAMLDPVDPARLERHDDAFRMINVCAQQDCRGDKKTPRPGRGAASHRWSIR